MASSPLPLVPPRSLKPRKPHDSYAPVVSVGQDLIYAERTGVIWDRSQLPEVVETEPPSIIACVDSADLLAQLHERFADNSRWQFRVTPIERDLWNPAREQQIMVSETVVHFVGFTTPGHRPNRFHKVLDPFRFSRDSLGDGAKPLWEELLTWAQQIRDFLVEQEMRLAPSSGGVGAQFLRDPRFYPDDRRRVPTATNERARPHLPGNHYQVACQYGTNKRPAAFYLDQHNAHHAAVLGLELPHADYLYSRGRFSNVNDRRPVLTGEAMAAFLREQRGLVKVRLTVTPRARARLSHPLCRRQGECIASVYTNELDELRESGAKVLGVIAAWTSPKLDEGLPAYARWAMDYLTEHAELRRWLKPTLLSPYGLLAAKPKQLRSLYATAKNGEATPIVAGRSIVTAYGKATKRAHQTPIANVIQRGMIEAEVRRRSLALARELDDQGREVVAIYSDALFVADRGEPVPMLPAPWRLKGIRHNLRFLSAHAFTSSEESRLPGIPANERVRYLQRRGKAA